MKQKKIGYVIGILISLAIIAGYLYSYLPLKQLGWGAGAPGEAGWVIAAIVSLLVAVYLTRNYLKTKQAPVKWLAGFVWCRALFFIFVALALPVYFLSGSVGSGICLSLFWIFVFLSFMWIPGFTCYFWRPEMKKPYQGLMIGIGVAAIILLIQGFQPAVYDAAGKFIFQAVPFAVGKWMYPIGKLLVMIPAGTLFLAGGLAASGKTRFRAIFWALGFYCVATTIFVPSMVGAFHPILAGLYCVVADICFGIGAAIRPKE